MSDSIGNLSHACIFEAVVHSRGPSHPQDSEKPY